MLLKDLGARFGADGRPRPARRVVAAQIGGARIAPTVVDGSGLSRADRTQPRQVVQLLGAMARGETARRSRASLPSPAAPARSRNRMRGTPPAGAATAKTGTLSGVSSARGLLPTRRRRTVAFAILMNNVSVWSAHSVQDRMVAAIAGSTS